MNTKEQEIKLCTKVDELNELKIGELTFTMFDKTKINVRLLHKMSNWTPDEFTCILKIFTNDINQTTLYDIYNLKDVN